MTGITALLLFAAMPVLLTLVYVGHRTTMVMVKKTPADSWTRGQSIEVPGFFVRAQHAQLNCLESLPVFGAIVLAAQALSRTALVDPLAPYVLLARLAQTTTHLIGVNPTLVTVRAVFFSIQVVLFLYMIVELLG